LDIWREMGLFGGTPEFWMRLQAEYDLKRAAQNKTVMERVARIVPLKPLKAAASCNRPSSSR
jgi:plasmid maintenance system antidote protein VapI